MLGDDGKILLSYNISKDKYIWAIYQNIERMLTGDLKGYMGASTVFSAFVIPKLVIEPDAIDTLGMVIM